MLCLLLAQGREDLNLERVLRLALIHDLGEVYVGDLTPKDAVDRDAKIAMERDAVNKILGPLPNAAALIADWEEYEAQASAEARFVKDIDRLEFALQAAHYQTAELMDSADLLKKVGAQLNDKDEFAAFKHLLSAE
jgi:putative hydrolase of HD superfamily